MKQQTPLWKQLIIPAAVLLAMPCVWLIYLLFGHTDDLWGFWRDYWKFMAGFIGLFAVWYFVELYKRRKRNEI